MNRSSFLNSEQDLLFFSQLVVVHWRATTGPPISRFCRGLTNFQSEHGTPQFPWAKMTALFPYKLHQIISLSGRIKNIIRWLILNMFLKQTKGQFHKFWPYRQKETYSCTVVEYVFASYFFRKLRCLDKFARI